MDKNNKKGVSNEAKAYARQVRMRFVEFLKSKGLSEVSNQSGCNYQALRNSFVEEGGYNPSLETIFQVKLGYGDEFDDIYVFTGKKIHKQELGEPIEKLHTSEIEGIKEQVLDLQTKLREKDEQIKELKEDKSFLQSIIKKQ